MDKPLHIFIAALGTARKRAHGAQVQLQKTGSKAEYFKGFSRTYNSSREGDAFNPASEEKLVPLVAQEVLSRYEETMSEEWDLELTVRGGNQHARADLVVDGQVLVAQAPASWLLYMEEQLREIRKFVDGMPTLDPAVRWEPDPNATGRYRSPVQRKAVTKKVQEPVVLIPPTEHHPGQAQLVTRDVIIGQWEQTDFATALTTNRKEQLLDRIDHLATAVKEARLTANATAVPRKAAARSLFQHIFAQ